MIPPVYITGTGVLCSAGSDRQALWESLTKGTRGIGPVRILDTDLRDFPVGEVPLTDAQLRQRAGAAEGLSRTSLMGILAVGEALSQAGLSDLKGIPLVSGTTVGGMDLTEKTFPDYSVSHDCGASTDAIAAHFGGTRATTVSTACSSAANALILGANLIRSGRADIVVAGGSECLTSFHLHGFHSLMILDPQPCRPFDIRRAGLNLGEGAAFLVLESEASVKGRKVHPLARLAGFGNACDAFHQTASSENGEGAFLAMSKALEMALLLPGDISYVNAHGTGTPNNDASESAALRRVFGNRIPPVSSTKAYTGHTTSASGSIEAVISVLCLQHQALPGQPAPLEPDPACILPQTGPLQGPVDHVLCNSFGFGGNDTSLLFSACR